MIAFSLKRSNIIFMEVRPDPELFEGADATGPVTEPAIELPRKDEPLEEMLPEEPALQAPARTTTFAFFGAALAPRTGMAAAKDAAAAAATKAHAALAAVAVSCTPESEDGVLT